jgi:hypothetical protein
MRPAQIHYAGTGKKQHEELEHAFADTKEGQLERAQQEAGFFNGAFDIRSERLKTALANKDKEPDEYEAALASFNELVNDLNEGDLANYSTHISTLGFAEEAFGHDDEKFDLKSD